MLTVDKLKINGFGRFQHQEFALSPGLNVIFGGNEAGKSTIHSFIEAMLFGFWKPNLPHREQESGWEKYRPWQGEEYGGEMVYTWSGGRVKVIRDFAENTVSLIDAGDGRPLADIPLNNWGEPDFARLHFGCSKLVFRNTISISQLGSATDTAVAQEVHKLLRNLAQSGGSGISVQQGLDILARFKRQTDFELMKTRAILDQTRGRFAAALEKTTEAARLEIEQYRSARALEGLGRERRQLKELAGQIQAQAAQSKLKRLETLRRGQEALKSELAALGEVSFDPSTYEQWSELQAEVEKAQELCKHQGSALAEVDERCKTLEDRIHELAPYGGFNKDTLIEMSSAWQMQAKGKQVIGEMEAQLESIGAEILEVTAELANFPYFRPDALEQAAALQAQARGGVFQSSQEDLEQELEEQERAMNRRKALRWICLLFLLGAGGAAWLVEPWLALTGIPVLLGVQMVNASLKKSNLRCRNLRREIYTREMEFLNSQRQREQAQRELNALFAKAGVDSIRELERKYYNFVKFSERNQELMREQKYISGKLKKYAQEAELKALELKGILDEVGLGGLDMDQALACFRENLDNLLDTKAFLEQCREQQISARQRLEQAQEELARAKAEQQQMMETLAVGNPEEVDALAGKHFRRQELSQQLLTLEQRVQDLLAGVSEPLLRQQAAAASEQDQENEIIDLPQKLENIDEQILTLQAQKSEGLGRLDGLYSDLPSPAELEEELWLQEDYCRVLEGDLQALDLASLTISGLADDLNRQVAPELNQMVSSLVQRITGGKYHDLQVDQDLSISVSTPAQGEHVDLGRLSGGTIDQFYFACRVAIADLVTGGGLPLFLDDSFVQYDDQRLQHMLRLLVELGDSRQIILLTCQQRELEQLAALAPGRYRSIILDD